MFGPLPEPPATSTDLTPVCLAVTLLRAATSPCGHPKKKKKKKGGPR